MKQSLLILCFIILAAACTTKHPCPSQNRTGLPLFINEVSETNVHADDLHKLRVGESVKAYSLGRWLDPNNSGIMHEGGIIYRMENDSAWNLQPDLPVKLPFTQSQAKLTLDDEDHLRAEIEVRSNEQRKLYQLIKKASDEATERIDVLNESLVIGQKLAQQNKNLKAELAQNRENNQKLLKVQAELKEKLEALLKFTQKRESDKIKSGFRRDQYEQ